MKQMPDSVTVFVRECKVDLCVGIFQTELLKTQPVSISVECTALASQHYSDIKEKDLSQVINYKPIYDFLTNDLPSIGHIYLLESAAEHIVSFCFRDPRVERVWVRIEKTKVFAQASGAGVELIRKRP
jgi:dihydroneopterin aldolase